MKFLIKILNEKKFGLQWCNKRFCNMLFDVVSCYWKSLCKMPSALFPLEHFSFMSYEQNILSIRITGKLMNIKKNKYIVMNNLDYSDR